MQLLSSAAPPTDAVPRFWVAHPHALLAEGLAAVLAGCGLTARRNVAVDGLPCAGCTAAILVTDRGVDMASLQAQCCRPPQVLVVDFHLPGTDVKRLLDQGVRGCVNADSGPEELGRAVKQMAAGHTYLCPLASKALADNLVNRPLTPRERDVLVLICDGLDNKTIGRRLNMALPTVKSHVKALMAKTQTNKRTQIAATALRQGWV
ncbi:helix-turn-helix transcriptional regulator [Roseateles cellulosilyticus]|uniref:Response regulator transcription factor n=1 Tax=Pelomonas cellulosilytica TaxID=2906762 RepID=A0ABS8XNL3_9BURK|nr:response regulator transcription factor [Pelomonas sp. P8]MCE4554366.1 response regulator transcription factor [Pelomonas sp. P8]